jgi:hypothetical protein
MNIKNPDHEINASNTRPATKKGRPVLVVLVISMTLALVAMFVLLMWGNTTLFPENSLQNKATVDDKSGASRNSNANTPPTNNSSQTPAQHTPTVPAQEGR